MVSTVSPASRRKRGPLVQLRAIHQRIEVWRLRHHFEALVALRASVSSASRAELRHMKDMVLTPIGSGALFCDDGMVCCWWR